MEPLAQAAQDMARLREAVDRHEREIADLRAKLAYYESPALLTLRAFCKRYGWTPGEVRSKLAARGENGLEAAVLQEKPGAKILIDPEKFFEILKRQQKRRRRR